MFPAQVFAFIQDTQAEALGARCDAARGGAGGAAARRRWSRSWTSKARCMCCGTGSSFTARPFGSPTSNRRTARTRGAGAVRQEPADGDAAGAVSSQRQPHGGHGAGGERPAGGHHRAEESRHGPELAARRAPIQGRPRSARAAVRVQEAGAGAFRRRPGRGSHDHTAGGGEDVFPAVQPRQPSGPDHLRRGQPAARIRLPHGLLLGGSRCSSTASSTFSATSCSSKRRRRRWTTAAAGIGW